jgi:hypothetical protein
MNDGHDRRDENHSQHEPLIYDGHPNPLRRFSAIKPNDENTGCVPLQRPQTHIDEL